MGKRVIAVYKENDKDPLSLSSIFVVVFATAVWRECYELCDVDKDISVLTCKTRYVFIYYDTVMT